MLHSREMQLKRRPVGSPVADDFALVETQVPPPGAGEVQVDGSLGLRARLPIDRMLAFTAALKNGQPTAGLVPHLGAV